MFLELHPCPKNGVSEATCRLGGAEVTEQRQQGRWETLPNWHLLLAILCIPVVD